LGDAFFFFGGTLDGIEVGAKAPGGLWGQLGEFDRTRLGAKPVEDVEQDGGQNYGQILA
jgi:hypothetical protein